MDKKPMPDPAEGEVRLTRRAFVGGGLAGGAALAVGRLSSLLQAAPAAAAGDPWIEASIPELQTLMASGQLTSREPTSGHRQRINSLNPLLGAVIQSHPNAVSVAVRFDLYRFTGHYRGA